MRTTRRGFFKTAGIAAGSLSLAMSGCAEADPTSKKDGHKRLNLSMASYTLRSFSREDAVAMTKRLGLKHIAFKSMHLPYDTPDNEITRIAQEVKAAGMDLYGCGVVYMKDESEVNRAFDYAKAASMSVIIGAPEHSLLELVNKKVQEYDIKLAIHNHGPGDDRYPSAESAYEKIKDMDPRMGLCIDIGHTKRIGLEPTEDVERFADRLHDIHIKDVHAASKEGSAIEAGRGVIDLPEFLRTLLKINYKGMVSLEYEKDADDPMPGAAESIGYFKGILSVI